MNSSSTCLTRWRASSTRKFLGLPSWWPRWARIQVGTHIITGSFLLTFPTAESFFMIESEPAMENVDVMTEATTAVTGFTRYTVAQTAMTGTSR